MYLYQFLFLNMCYWYEFITTYLYFCCFSLFLSKEPESPPVEMNSLVTLENFMKVLMISYLVFALVQILQTRISVPSFIIYISLIFNYAGDDQSP